MKNRVYDSKELECFNIVWTNNVAALGTGAAAAVASGDVVSVGGKAHIAFGDIAVNASGTLVGSGTFNLTAVSGDTWSQGARLGYNFSTKKIDPLGPALFVAPEAKTSGQTTAKATILLQSESRLIIKKTPDSTDDSNNYATITHTRGANPNTCIVQIRNTSGVQRAATITFPDTSTIRIADASLATTDVIEGFASWVI